MSKRTRSTRRSKRSSRTGITLSYGGPVRMNTFGGQDSRPIKANLSYSYALASNSSGVAAEQIRIQGLLSCSDWASYASLYQEFRVLAIQWDFIPNFNGSYDSTVTQGSGATAVVHVPLTTPPSSMDEVVQHATWKPLRSSMTNTRTWKMYGVQEAVFSDVLDASTTNNGGIVYYMDSLSSSTFYGRGVVTYLVEFRARK